MSDSMLTWDTLKTKNKFRKWPLVWPFDWVEIATKCAKYILLHLEGFPLLLCCDACCILMYLVRCLKNTWWWTGFEISWIKLKIEFKHIVTHKCDQIIVKLNQYPKQNHFFNANVQFLISPSSVLDLRGAVTLKTKHVMKKYTSLSEIHEQ